MRPTSVSVGSPTIGQPAIVALPRTEMRRARRKYIVHKCDARQRGIGWEFDFAGWLSTWWSSGRWHQRGHHRGEYVMSRPGDGLTPYGPNTVAIVTGNANLVEGTSHPCTPQRAAAISRGTMGHPGYFAGRRHTAESRARMSEAVILAAPFMKKRPRNEPWLAAGISRSMWYRRRAACEVSP